jgi:hypothetical protein
MMEMLGTIEGTTLSTNGYKLYNGFSISAIGVNSAIRFNNGDILINNTSATQYVRFDTANSRVGIGTTTPAYKLDVSGSGNFTNNLTVTGSLTVSGSSTLTNIGPAIFSGSLTVTEGITGSLFGTSSYALTASYLEGYVDPFPYTGSAEITGSLIILGDVLTINPGNSDNAITINNGGYLKFTSGINSFFRGFSTNFAFLDASFTPTFSVSWGGGTSYINTGGAFAIGTTTATSRLQVKGSGTTSATTAFRVEDANASGSMVVLDDGQIQVRSTTVNNPGYSFIDNTDTGLYMIGETMGTVVDGQYSILYNNAGPQLYSNTTNSITSANLLMAKIGSNHRMSIWMNGNNDFQFEAWQSGVGYSNNIILQGLGGNVGIGTTSPSYKLEIDDSANAVNNYITVVSNNSNNSGVLFKDASGNRGLIFANPDNELVFMANGTSEKMRITSGGNVGIGTTAPTSRLQVQGSGATNATTAFRVENANASGSMVVLDDGNVGIGTTTPTEKLSVVGKIDLNDGGNSVFIGTGAGLNDDASNNQNVGVGYQSLRSNTTGAGNTANGFNSLYANTTGTYNTANGYNALRFNTTGGNNTANGFQALYSNTTGTNNTANGFYSLYSNTTGVNNTANGVYSLFSNTTGNNNTANGVYSLFSNTTGGYNIATGRDAGRFISDGTTANTITDNSVYLGYNTKALADNQTNQIVIGYEATGIGSNTVVLGNDSIVTTALKGNVGIGTTSPAYKLDIQTPQGGTLARFKDSDSSYPGIVVVGDTNAGWLGNNSLLTGEGIYYQNNLNVIRIYTNSAERMRLDASGNLGIGTTPPTARLQVKGSGTTSATTAFRVENANASGSMVVLDDGNVGIGTTSPSEKLEVSEGYILSSGASTSHGFELQRTGYDTYQLRHLDGGLTVVNSTDSRKEMTFDGAGNVGIGTTTPTSKLQVNGDTILSSSLYSSRQSSSLNAGDTLLYQVNTGSYTAGFFDYYATSGSNGRAGTIMSFWLNGSIVYSDNSTTDIGTTLDLAFSMSISESYSQLYVSASTDSWTVKTTFRTI